MLSDVPRGSHPRDKEKEGRGNMVSLYEHLHIVLPLGTDPGIPVSSPHVGRHRFVHTSMSCICSGRNMVPKLEFLAFLRHWTLTRSAVQPRWLHSYTSLPPPASKRGAQSWALQRSVVGLELCAECEGCLRGHRTFPSCQNLFLCKQLRTCRDQRVLCISFSCPQEDKNLT